MAAVVCWAVVCLFPLYWVAVTSLKSGNDITSGPTYLPFVDFAPTLDAWNYILFDKADTVVPSFINSAGIGICATLLTTVFACMFVFGLTRYQPFPQWALPLVLSSRVLPPVVLALPAYLMAAYTHTLDSWFALIITYTAINLPVAVWLLYPVFGTRSTEQEEAAMLEGASQFGVLFGILVPMIASGVGATAAIIFILCWNETTFANTLTTNHAITLPPFLEGQMSIKEAQVAGEAEEWSRFSAVTLLLVLPLIAFSTLVQRALIRATGNQPK
jgi:multiple sugar transport system permease protein